ncbi:hypothetical protein [Enterococcus cecorum]
MTLTFKVYDRAFVELVLNNGGTELGSPITIVVEHQEELPILDNYEDGELIPIRFNGLNVYPRKIQKKSFVGEGQPMIDTWQFSALKISVTSCQLGEVNEPNTPAK